MDSEQNLREEIVMVGRLLYEHGLIVAADGNISARLAGGRVLATPSGACKGRLAPDDLVVVDLEGRQLSGARRPSSELPLHLAVYRARDDALAVVHAHPPTAVACTVAGVALDECPLPEALMTLGPVPTAPYALTGTSEMFAAVAPLLPHHNAFLLSHHGALTLGRTLERALMRMEQIEHVARIMLAAHQLGGARPLPPERYVELAEYRRRLGLDRC